MDTNKGSRKDVLRDQAIELRGRGWSNPDIRAELGVSGWALTEYFHGLEPKHEKLRVRAKDELRAQARDLRMQGWSYDAIARKLKVAKSSCSLWLKDLPKPEVHHPGEPPAQFSYMTQWEWADFCAQRQERYRERKAEERRAELVDAAGEIGELTERELLLVGAAIYWCEGAKTKPWRRQNSVVLINSDPQLIQLFIRFLESVGFGRDQLLVKINIHENADLEEAVKYWTAVTGVSLEQFRKPVIKKHSPKTKRLKVGDHYHGALTVMVRRSSKLYRRIEGWARAVMLGTDGAVADIRSMEEPPW